MIWFPIFKVVKYKCEKAYFEKEEAGTNILVRLPR